MENDDFKKIKKLEKQLTAAVFLFIITIATGAWIIFGLVAKQSALALSGNYSKSSGEQLNVDDWNNLVADFVDASGDIITGPLNLNDTLNHITASPFYINSNNGLQLRINTDGGTDKFNINNNNNDKIFTVTNAGEVGIGTDSPGAKLEVNGDIKANSVDIGMVYVGTTPCVSINTVPAGNTNWPFKAGNINYYCTWDHVDFNCSGDDWVLCNIYVEMTPTLIGQTSAPQD